MDSFSFFPANGAMVIFSLWKKKMFVYTLQTCMKTPVGPQCIGHSSKR